MEKKNMGPSWVAIVLLLLLIWPVGLFLLIKKLTNRRYMLSGKNTGAIVAAVIMLLFGISIVSGNGGSAGMVVFGISYLAGGALTVLFINKGRKDADRFRKYIDIVVNGGERNIDKIAGYVALPYDKVVKDLDEMIKLEFFRGAVVDKTNGKIQLREMNVPGQQQQQQQQQQVTVVRCSNCGANNTIPIGMVTECEYCGAPLMA
jgi:hypothetical protein